MDTQTALSELASLCAVISETDGKVPERYVTPWRGEKGAALAVVAPRNHDEIQNLIRFARDKKLRLLAQGERTGLVGGSVPNIADAMNTIIVSMERFKSRCEYFPADRRVIVDAGYTLDEVNDYLKQYGMHIPIDVSSNPMIGGAIATNIGGSRVVRFGDARRLLMGVEVILADDETSIYSTLLRPRKDNSSPNFTGVFCGSFGAYGIITAGAFEVFPQFSSTYTAWMSLKDDVDVADVLQTIESKSSELLLACEFVSKEALEKIGNSQEVNVKVPFSDGTHDVIFVEWGTVHEDYELESFAEALMGFMINQNLIEEIEIVPPTLTWQMRHVFSDVLRKTGKLIGNDISVPRNRISDLRHQAKKVIEAYNPSLKVRDFGHLGDGGLHINVIVEDLPEQESWSEEKSNEVRRLIAEVAMALGGSFSAEHGLGTFNTHLYRELGDKVSMKLAREFKSTCDPDNILGHSGIVL